LAGDFGRGAPASFERGLAVLQSCFQAARIDLACASELKRLRRENAILRQERDILKRATAFFRQGGKSMRFVLIDQAKVQFPVQRLCSVLGVSRSGYFAWKDRPACRRQREDLVLLAHARSAFALSNGTCGSPRMTRELPANGFAVGRRRTARLMRKNDIKARQTRRLKRTTDSKHSWPVASNIIDQDFAADRPNQKWGVDISYVWTREGWNYLAAVRTQFTGQGHLQAGSPSTLGVSSSPSAAQASLRIGRARKSGMASGPKPMKASPSSSLRWRLGAAGAVAR
jgi:hypothetical protein